MNKFELVRDVLAAACGARSGPLSLVDVGCRGCELEEWLQGRYEYTGVDLVQNAHGTVDHVVDVTRGLPFPDASHDIVVALDVVEHLDDMPSVLDDFIRVARGHVLVMLPNMAFISHRLRFLLSGRIGEKYDLRYGQGVDRHRWLTTQAQGDAFIRAFAAERGLECEVHWHTGSRKKNAFAAVCRVLGLSPNLWVWTSLYVLKRR